MPTPNFQSIRLLDLGCWYEFTYWMANSADPDQLASSEANWSGSTLFAKVGHIWVQQDKGWKQDQQMTLSYNVYATFCVFFLSKHQNICCGYLFELHQQVDAIQMGTHNICLYKEVNKKNNDCYLRLELLDCVVCAVIKSNTVMYLQGLDKRQGLVCFSCDWHS